MNAEELKRYKISLDKKNINYETNEKYYCGRNPVILKDIKKDKHGLIQDQDRRIPLPIARKVINTWAGFQFSDIQYKETGSSLNNLVDFSNLMAEANRTIDVTKETEYFKYFKSVNQYNDNDVLDLVTAIGCANHGRAYKIYYFTDNMLKCDTIPSNQIEPIYTDTINPQMEKAIRYYHDCTYDSKGEETKIYYADVYTASGVEYYIAKKDDYSDAILNPEKSAVVYGSAGNTTPKKIHIIEFNIFRDKSPLISHAYGMIDEIDRVLSKNMAEELAGFKAAILRMSASVDDIHRDEQGLTAYDRLLKTNIIDNQFKEDIMEWVSKTIQDSFIFGVYDRLKKDIFELVDIPNFSDAESWGNTISGVSAGYRLLGFIFLCNQTFRIWQEGKRQEIDLINAYIEILADNTEVKRSMNELEIKSNRILPKNILENAQIAGLLKGIIPNSDLIKMFPEIVSDPDGAIKELDDQLKKENDRLMNSLNEPTDELTEKTDIEEEK